MGKKETSVCDPTLRPRSDGDSDSLSESMEEEHEQIPGASSLNTELFRSSKGVKIVNQWVLSRHVLDEESQLDESLQDGIPDPPRRLQSSRDIYAQLLATKGRGFPLWIPEPNQNLSVAYRREGISIGDVGILTHLGGFSFLFNIFRPQGDPKNPPVLPDNFAPLAPLTPSMDICLTYALKGNSCITSSSVRKLKHGTNNKALSFETTVASDTAILVIPEGATSEDLENTDKFRRYIQENLEDWYRYARGTRGRDIKNGDLRVVTGWDKSTSWGMATTERHACRLIFKALDGLSSASDRIPPAVEMYAWDYSGQAEAKVGPDARETAGLDVDNNELPGRSGPEARYENQCLFVRTSNPRLGDATWARLNQELSVQDEYENSDTLEPEPGPSSSKPSSKSTRGSKDSTTSKGKTRQSTSAKATLEVFSAKELISLAPEDPTRAFDGSSVLDLQSGVGYHPSDALNRLLLLEVPTSEVAVTQDQDWISVLKEEDTSLPSFTELYRRIAVSKTAREENGVVFFETRPPTSTSPANAADVHRSSKETARHREDRQPGGLAGTNSPAPLPTLPKSLIPPFLPLDKLVHNPDVRHVGWQNPPIPYSTNKASSPRNASSVAPSGPRSLMSLVHTEHRYRYQKYADQAALAQPVNRNLERPTDPQTPAQPSLGPETQPSEIPTPSRSLPTPVPSNPLDRAPPKSPSADMEIVPDSEPMAPEYEARNLRRAAVPTPRTQLTLAVPQGKNRRVNRDEDVEMDEATEQKKPLQQQQQEEEQDVPLAAVTRKRTKAAPAPPKRTQNKRKGKAIEADEEEEAAPAQTKPAAMDKAPAPVGKKPAARASRKASALPSMSKNLGRSWETAEIPSSVPEQDIVDTRPQKATNGVKPTAAAEKNAPRTRQASKAPALRGKRAASFEDSDDEILLWSDRDNGTEPADEAYRDDADKPPRKRQRVVTKAPTAGKKARAAPKRGQRSAATPATQVRKLRSAVSGSSRANGARAMRVFALWKADGHYYPGVVHSKTTNSDYLIAYDDDTQGIVSIDQLRLGQLRVGDEVIWRTRNRSDRVVNVDDVDNGRIQIALDDDPEDVLLRDLKISSKAIQYNFNDRLLTHDDIIPTMAPAKRTLSPSPPKSSMVSVPAASAPASAPAQVLAKTALIVTLNAERGGWEKEKLKLINAIRTSGGVVIDDIFSVIRMDGHFADNNNNCYIFEQREVAWIGDPDIIRLFLVADEYNQKPKFLTAVALGIPCLSTNWLEGSVQDGLEREWIGYMLPQGQSNALKCRVSQQVDCDWGNSKEYVKHLPSSPVAAKLFANMHILCVGSQMVPQAKGKWQEEKVEAAKVVPRIILAMGAETVECVTEPRHATRELDEYNYIVIREPDQYVSELPPPTTVHWSWVKECLIASRYFPVPTWATAGEYSQEA